MKNKPVIRAADFVEACCRFFRDDAADFGVIEKHVWPPPSPEVKEILIGLQQGWISKVSKPPPKTHE